MSALLFIALLVIVFSIIILIRNEIVYKAKLKSIAVAKDKALKLIRETEPPWDTDSIWAEWEAFGPSYNGMMLNLFKWKYEHFYPDWE